MKRVYIWLVERTDDVGWDETAGVVVAAHTEAEALAVQPANDWAYMRPKSPTLKATRIGTAAPGTKPGTIFLADFNAG